MTLLYKPVYLQNKISRQNCTERGCCFRTALKPKLFAQGADLKEYTSDVLPFCTETVMTTKTIKEFPNQKPWLDRNVQLLLGASGLDIPACKSARRDLNTGIREAGCFFYNDKKHPAIHLILPYRTYISRSSGVQVWENREITEHCWWSRWGQEECQER